ncbi:nucleoside deaminase [Phocicoccus pinnipedialis]|uniref:Guanine deaminase n=1 Tax=Phocicoccus pinnipedialis TaxID=110845 RepID=A0A6V7RAJ5_9BACL|nr:nucleoside deaminase [Jeotgalicoccus pinnipedialis]MBP1940160.1 tRNA(Arg) A34 adenosine deaminase TadA [Jeotgalicoccus pinnipedialis]CAD2073792.1 Guanine deaminase [Jeotgalicoccus pinnipedialis]
MLTEKELGYLEIAVQQAEQALKEGNQPFGSVLVSDKGEILFKDNNHISTGDNTRHPEFEIARWASQNMTAEERKKSVVYTSGEHCPMCATAHGINGLGKIVYATSSDQFRSWQDEFGVDKGNIKSLSIEDIVAGIEVVGPVKEFEDRVKELQRQYYSK